jgi:hypothetical protein
MVWKEYAASGKPVEEAIAQLADQMSQVAADVHGLKRKEELREAETRAFVGPGLTRWKTATGGTFVAAVPNQEMSQYDYLHGWVPQGGEEAPLRFIKGEAEEEPPPVDEPPKDEA